MRRSNRTIYCSYMLHPWCKNKFPNREVIATVYCDDSFFYYFSRKSTCRVDTRTGKIWSYELCNYPLTPFVKEVKSFIYTKPV